MRIRWVVLALTVLVLGAGCADDETSSGPVSLTMEMFVEDPMFEPLTGTGPFDVTEGADTLGCSSGTVADQGVIEDSLPDLRVNRVWTCTSGDREGTFTASVVLSAASDFNVSEWEIIESTGDFAGLQGTGEGQAVNLSPDADGGLSFTDNYSGEIEYGS